MTEWASFLRMGNDIVLVFLRSWRPVHRRRLIKGSLVLVWWFLRGAAAADNNKLLKVRRDDESYSSVRIVVRRRKERHCSDEIARSSLLLLLFNFTRNAFLEKVPLGAENWINQTTYVYVCAQTETCTYMDAYRIMRGIIQSSPSCRPAQYESPELHQRIFNRVQLYKTTQARRWM